MATPRVYDSGILYPQESAQTLTPEQIQLLGIPSSRYFYYGPGNNPIPTLAFAGVDPRQLSRDIQAWLEPTSSPTVYSQTTVESVDPGIDLINVINGTRVLSSERYRPAYIREFGGLLDETRGFALRADRKFIEQMLKYPFNPKADFIKASSLARDGFRAEIDSYLRERGVLTFTVNDIYRLPESEIFFYLTRFYGPPVEGNLEAETIKRIYRKRANNNNTVALAAAIPEHLSLYRSLTPQFDAYFNAINADPDNPDILQGLGSSSYDRLYANFFDYFRLFTRPRSLPPLTLNTIRQLRANGAGELEDFLRNYTDQEIIHLVGEGVDSARSRTVLLERAARELIETRVFILNPEEAELCNNPESFLTAESFSELSIPFLGRGSLSDGFDCYTIEELHQSFLANQSSDGTFTFADPLHRNVNFRTSDLREFLHALESRRTGTTVPQSVTRLFEQYIARSEAQDSSDYQQIRNLKAWVSQSPQNKELMREFWLAYFRMGMYMRQWRGPGNPYPILAEQTGQEVAPESATGIEISTNVSQQKEVVDRIMGEFPEQISEIIRNLRVLKRNAGRAQQEGTTIIERWNGVITGRYCIRMASGPWAFTGAYYLKQILNEEIPGFDLGSNIQSII